MSRQILLHDTIMCIRCKYDFVITPMVDRTLACSLIVEVGRTNPNDHLKSTVGVEILILILNLNYFFPANLIQIGF